MQKIEYENNEMIDKKEKIFFQEVENLKSEFVEEKQKLKESICKLSKEREKSYPRKS